MVTRDRLDAATVLPAAWTPDVVFRATDAGDRELRGRVTDLPAHALELLVRLDGTSPLQPVRAAMPHVDDAGFERALQVLVRRGLVETAERDGMEESFGQQLQMLGAGPGGTRSAAQASLRRAGFAVSLVRRPAGRAAAGRGSRLAVVVEDDPSLARFIECFLRLDGFDVRLAANRSEVVAELSRPVTPDIVLLDASLPDTDGFEILRRLRRHPRLHAVPVVMLTGRATRESVLQALTAGADGYITKPFQPDDLSAAVRTLVEGVATGWGAGAGDPWINRDAAVHRAAA
jgi:CheY-like chemotaxis protein